jgi:NADH-quinone oxidoreductase subunit J
MLGSVFLAQLSPPSPATPLIAPALLFVLAVVAAVGLILLLPGRRDTPLRAMGGVVLFACGIILAVQLGKLAAGSGTYFWIFAAIAIIGAVRVITHPKPVYSALYFVLTVLASAGLFALMWAQFMAAALILIYAGAILVTYVFVIMLAAEASPTSGASGPTSMREQLAEHDAVSREPVVASAVGFALMGVLLFLIADRSPAAIAPAGPGTTSMTGFTPVGATQQLGAYLFDKQLINLELAGLILTVAMVGAIVIARKRVVSVDAADRGVVSETLTAPMTPIDDNPHSIPVYGTENPRQKEYPET